MSLKTRLTLASFGLFVVILSIAGWFVLREHRASSLGALDDGLVTRLDDLAALEEQGATPQGLGISEAEDTLAMIIAADGAVRMTTDRFGDPREILDLVRPGAEPATVALSSFEETHGIDRMRILTSQGPEGQVSVVGQSLRSVDQSVADLWATLLMVGPALALAGAATTWLIVRSALLPVEAIRRQAAEISLSDLDRRVPAPPGHDELATLASTLNDMLARLERSADAQRRLVADVAHELRSPLTGVVTQLEVGVTHPDDVDWPSMAEDALDEARRLQTLIDHLLFLARLDSDPEPTIRELVDLDDVVHATIDRIAMVARVTIDRSAVGAGVVRGDPGQLERCIRNLVDNAVRFAETGVVVGLSESAGRVVLTVTDDGPGIPETDRDRIFERFHRVASARDRDSGGTGLGLAIVREVITAHGGTIEAEASHPSGTTMTVLLPAAAGSP